MGEQAAGELEDLGFKAVNAAALERDLLQKVRSRRGLSEALFLPKLLPWGVACAGRLAWGGKFLCQPPCRRKRRRAALRWHPLAHSRMRPRRSSSSEL